MYTHRKSEPGKTDREKGEKLNNSKRKLDNMSIALVVINYDLHRKVILKHDSHSKVVLNHDFDGKVVLKHDFKHF